MEILYYARKHTLPASGISLGLASHVEYWQNSDTEGMILSEAWILLSYLPTQALWASGMVERRGSGHEYLLQAHRGGPQENPGWRRWCSVWFLGYPPSQPGKKSHQTMVLVWVLKYFAQQKEKGAFLLLINLRVIGCWPHGHLKVEFSVLLRDILNKYCFYQNNQMLSALSIL